MSMSRNDLPKNSPEGDMLALDDAANPPSPEVTARLNAMSVQRMIEKHGIDPRLIAAAGLAPMPADPLAAGGAQSIAPEAPASDPQAD